MLSHYGFTGKFYKVFKDLVNPILSNECSFIYIVHYSFRKHSQKWNNEFKKYENVCVSWLPSVILRITSTVFSFAQLSPVFQPICFYVLHSLCVLRQYHVIPSFAKQDIDIYFDISCDINC